MYRILVAVKGEAGYLTSQTGEDMRTFWSATLDDNQAATYPSMRWAEKIMAKIAGKFDHAEIVEA